MAFSNLPFPSRPLAFKGDVISMPPAYLVSTVGLLVLTLFFLYWQAPDLFRDYAISQHPVTLADASIQNARCKTHRGIFTDCEAHLVYNYNGRSYEADSEMFFVDFHIGAYNTGVVISADKPELATLGIGVEKIWNRIISLAVLVLILGGGAMAMILLAFRVRHARTQLLRPESLVPVPVEISAFTKNRQGRFLTYSEVASGRKTMRLAYTQLAVGQEPLIIGENKGKAVALGVRHGKTMVPVLLDRRLERLDLSAEERAQVLAPFADILASSPSLDAFNLKKKPSLLRGVIAFFAVILLVIAGALGYWLWYVTSAPSPFTSPAMDINNMMPAPLNKWGCDQLKKRFGNGNAPYGCVAADFTSWR